MQRSNDHKRYRYFAGMWGRVNDFRRQTGPTPFNKIHVSLLRENKNTAVGKLRAEMGFNRWVNRPNSAKALYWRTHRIRNSITYAGTIK